MSPDQALGIRDREWNEVAEPTGYGQSDQHFIGQLLGSESGVARLLRWAVVLVAVAFGLKHSLDFFAPPRSYVKDFLASYALSRAVLLRADPYMPLDRLAAQYVGHLGWSVFPHPSPYPPPVSLAFLPLALLDYSLAAQIWLVLGLMFLGISVYLIAQTVGTRPTFWGSIALVIALLSWAPVYDDLMFGNVNSLILLLTVGAWVSLRSRDSAVGGVLLGCALLVKPLTWPLVFLLAIRRNWRGVTGSVGTVLIGYGLAAAALGPAVLVEYVTRVIPAEDVTYRASAINLSLGSIGWRLFDGTGLVLAGHFLKVQITAPPLVLAPAIAQIVSVGVTLAVFVGACLVARRVADFDTAFALMICVSILISPISWEHYLVLTMLPIALVVARIARRGFPSSQTNAVVLVGALLAGSMPVWESLAVLVGEGVQPRGYSGDLSFAPALLTYIPTVATIGISLLVVMLHAPEMRAPAKQSAPLASAREMAAERDVQFS